MTRTERLRARWPVAPRAHAWAAWAALLLFTIIVSSGAAVRLTGSGLGCPEWPRCNSRSVTPQDGHAYIEFANRMVTTPVSIAAILCLVFALLRRPYRRDFTVLGAALCVGVAIQAVLGGVAVLTGLNPLIVMGHFLLSMGTLVIATMLVWRTQRERAGRPQAPERDALLVRALRGLVVVGGAVVILGTTVTASGPYAGGAGTGDDDVSRFTIFGSGTFKTMIMLHARLATAFGVLAVAAFIFAHRRGARDLRAPLAAVCVVVAIAGLIGNLQYHVLNYPAWLVWMHVSVATVLWATLVWTFLAAGHIGAPQRAPAGRAAAPAEPPPASSREPAAARLNA